MARATSNGKGESRRRPPAIELVGVTKRFRKRTLSRGYTTVKTRLLRGLLENLFTRKTRRGNFLTALDDIHLRVEEGKTLGVIGHNGSGKSTLLKLVTGIYKPDAGQIHIHGRVSALIELGAGFHPEFTGRENIFLNGLVLGLKKDYIERKFHEIVAFADLEDFIDDPVRTYSSGMYMRLGFSIAIHVDPDILIVDEVLAVGDEAFIHKCQERVADFKRRGKTIVLVTHDLGAIERWCDEVVLLDHGHLVEWGGPRRVIDTYRRMVAEGEERRLSGEHRRAAEQTQNEQTARVAVNMGEVGQATTEHPERNRWGTREIEIVDVQLVDGTGAARYVYESGEAVTIAIRYTVHKAVPRPVFGIGIFRPDGVCCYGTNTHIDRADPDTIEREGVVTCALESLELIAGDYLVDVAVHAEDGYAYDYHTRRWSFAIRSAVGDVGVYRPRHTWSFA
ncbi:MAG: ABC transporter ATP-binding protein [bacterium]